MQGLRADAIKSEKLGKALPGVLRPWEREGRTQAVCRQKALGEDLPAGRTAGGNAPRAQWERAPAALRKCRRGLPPV